MPVTSGKFSNPRGNHAVINGLGSVLDRLGERRGVFQGLILGGIALVAFATRLFSVIRFESVIHEFDPWFNFRATKYLVDHGWYAFLNWFDERAWYPLGRVVGVTVYPGIMITAAMMHWIVNKVLVVAVDIRDVCVFLAPVFAGATAVATFLMTKELADDTTALIAASMIAIVPGYISRSVAGSYDNEGIAIFLMMATFFCWIRGVRRGSAAWGVATAAFYFYMVSSWGGYVFLINLIPLHVFMLLLMGRYSTRLYVSYCTFYVLGTLASMTIPFVGLMPSRSNEHMASMGVFCLLQLMALSETVKRLVDDEAHFRRLTRTLIIAVSGILLAGLVGLTLSGHIAPWTGRFYSLWDTGYARKHIPIIASVSEHQPTTWASFFMDMHMLLFLAPAGLWFCFKDRQDGHIFAIMYVLTGVYFAGVMVRLMLTLAPIMCVLGAMAVGRVISAYLPGSSPSPPPMPLSASPSMAEVAALARDKTGTVRRVFPEMTTAVLATCLVLMGYFVWHCTWVTSSAYSSPSIMMSNTDQRTGRVRIIDDFREAYYWLRRNTPDNAKVLAWWDYGYQIAGMADRTTIVDNNTWNNTHIATVGLALALPEHAAYPLLRKLHVDYVLILSGAISGFTGDDMNKFPWMVRIAEGVYPDRVRERDYLTRAGDYRLDAGAPAALQESLLYKMTYNGVAELMGSNAVDRARQASLKGINPKLHVLEEAYTTENHTVRIYKVKQPDPLGRSHFKTSR